MERILHGPQNAGSANTQEEIDKIRHAVHQQYGQHAYESTALKRIRHWLHLDATNLQAREKQALDNALQHSVRLQTVYQLKHELANIWARSAATQEQLLKNLEDWCHRAEASGIQALQEFSYRLRCYKMA